jgi:hypothetical protein
MSRFIRNRHEVFIARGAGNGLGSTAAPTCIIAAISIVGPSLVAWSVMN